MMANIRIDIESIACTDSAGLKKFQAKLNQWITKGELKKFDKDTTSTHIIYTVCRTVPAKVEKVEDDINTI